MGRLGTFRKVSDRVILVSLTLLATVSLSDAQLPLRVGVIWRANTEPDLAGYHIYYGPTNRVYTNRVTVGRTATLAIIEPLAAGGTYHLAITAFSESGVESLPSHELVYSVPSINTAPYITPIADQGTLEDLPTGSIPFAISDGESPAEALLVTARSSNQRLVPDPYILIGGAGSDRALMVVPQLDQAGETLVTVEVRDPQGATSSATFTLGVTPVNDRPVVSPIGNRTIDEDSSGGTVPFYIFDAEHHPDDLWLVAISSNPLVVPDETITITGTGNSRALSFAPAKNVFGSSSIQLYVVDLDGAYVATEFAVVVRPINDPPTILPLQNVVLDEDIIGSLVPVNVADADDPPGELQLTAFSSNPLLIAPETIVIGGVGSQRTMLLRPRLNEFGSAVIGVVARDAQAGVSSNSFTVVVNPVNDMPTLDPIGDFSIHEGSAAITVPLLGITSGAANEAQTLRISAVSDQPAIVPIPEILYTSPNATGSLLVAPIPNISGAATITVSVNDGASTNAIISRSFKVAVQAFNNPPVIYSLPDLIVAQIPLPLQINFTVQDPDTTAEGLVLTAYSSDPGILPNNNLVFGGAGMNRTLTVNTAGRTGLVTVTVIVSDGDASVSASFYVLVTAAGGLI